MSMHHMKSDLQDRPKKDYEKLSPPSYQVRYSIFTGISILKQLAHNFLNPFIEIRQAQTKGQGANLVKR